jgi:hypothetical protein
LREEPSLDQKQIDKAALQLHALDMHARGSVEKEIIADSRHKMEQDDDKRV